MTTAVRVEPVTIGPTWRRNAAGRFVLPRRTLGWEILGWTHEYLEQPDGPDAGDPWKFTDEQARFLLWWYALDEHGRFVYRDGVLQRMKGWGKDPLGAAVCAVEFVGPCRFGGWGTDGKPLAIPHLASWVQTAAVAIEQTKNTMTLFPGLFSTRAITEFGIDLGKEKIYAYEGQCRIEAVTSAPRTMEGHRPTFVLMNEPHHWLANNEGHAMARVIVRNLGKSRDGSARSLRITNAHNPGEDSVARQDLEAYETQGEDSDILYDSVEAPEDVDLDDDEQLRAAIEACRGDSYWLDVARVMKECRDPRASEPEKRRYWLNQNRSDRSGWITPAEWGAIARDETVEDGALVTLGFDGSRFRDSTALVATVVATGFQWVIRVWERPEGVALWEIDAEEVTETVAEAFERYAVWRMYCDPYWWEDTIAHWAGRWGDDRVVFFHTNRLGAMSMAVKDYETSVRAAELGHAPDETFAEHVANSVKRPTGFKDEDGLPLYVIKKESQASPHKIDIAVAAVLSQQARKAAIAAGALDDPDPQFYTP